VARLKNTGDPMHVYAPPGAPNSLFVDAGQIIEVPGEITDELDDAYLVGTGDDQRAWSKAQWSATSKTSHDAAKTDDSAGKTDDSTKEG
jgi:DNA-binding transcriptional regulator/RsmH inhibitor MraZ